MRGIEQRQTSMFHFVSVEDRVPASHPLRAVRTAAIEVLEVLSPRMTKLYAASGRAAIPPEQLLRAMLLWALYGVPSERRLLEELDYNLLFRWFTGLGIEDEVWPRTTFHMNRRRILASGIAGEFFARCLVRMRGRLLYNDHFNLNQSLIESWSGQTTLGDESDAVEVLAPKSDDAPPV